MENSLSASQYPQERAESHTRAKAQERAGEPPRERASLSRKAARPLGVKRGASSAVRLAMMAGGSAGWRGTRSLEQEAERRGEESGGGGGEKKKTSRKTTFTTLQRRVREPFLPGTSLQHFLQRRTPRLPEKPQEKKVDPCGEECFGCDF